MKRFHHYSGEARQLVAAVDDGHGYELPSDSPVPQEAQGAFWRGGLDSSLLSQHLSHLLSVITFTPQCLESYVKRDVLL